MIHPELALNRYGHSIRGVFDGALIHLLEIWEVQQRIREQRTRPGDSVRLLRSILALSGGSAGRKDLARLVLVLARDTEDEVIPWQLMFVQRRQTTKMRAGDKQHNRNNRAWDREQRDHAIFLRVLDYLTRTGCTLEQAYVIVAAAKDAPLSQPASKVRAYSRAVVKRAYEDRLKIARKTGKVERWSGMFRTRYSPLPQLRRPGRPKKK